jgi:hypothetical protein
MKAMISLVVTCSKRKALAPASGLRLREVPPGDPVSRAQGWIGRLEAHQGERLPASKLYVGEQWSLIRTLVEERQDIRIWICSAGYGLISADTLIAPYSATFSANHPDLAGGVGGSRADGLRRWWEALATWPGPDASAPRTVADLARQDPSSPILIAASPAYLDPMRRDVEAVLSVLSDRALLSIFSAGTTGLGGVSECLIPFDGRLRLVLGGSLMGLNVRVIAALLRQRVPLRVPELSRAADALGFGVPTLPVHSRARQSDEDVLAFIQAELRKDPVGTWSGLHRRFRQSGRACEQKRFRALFRAAAGADAV